MAAGSDPHVTSDHPAVQDRRQAGSSQGTLDLLTVDVTSAWVHWYNCRAIRSQRIGRVSTGPIAPRFLSRGSSRKPSSSVNAKPTT